MEINFHKHFDRQFLKLPQKMQQKIQQRLILFISNPFDPELSNHALFGKYTGRRIINVTDDLRVIYEIKNNSVYFVQIGTHSELYS